MGVRTYTAVFALLIIVTVFVSSSFLAEDPEPSVYPDLADKENAFRCLAYTDKPCTLTTLEQTLDNCDAHATELRGCNWTDDPGKVRKTTLITSNRNYVTARLTDEPYSHILHPLTTDGWDLEISPAGSKIATQQTGEIIRITDSETQTLASIDVVVDKNAGLMGLALDPQFEQNNRIYFMYAHRYRNFSSLNPQRRLIELRIDAATVTDSGLTDRNTLLTGIPAAPHHAGGRLEIGPDSRLYATVGDANMPGPAEDEYMQAQNRSSLAGAIIRLNRDGAVPEDNPFDNSYIYSYGHRNPQGIAWHPDTGSLYASEHGGWRFDEINKIHPGNNYGWGDYECDLVRDPEAKLRGEQRRPAQESRGTTAFPLRCFKNWTLAPSGMAFVNEKSHPWHGNLFIAGLKGLVYRLDIADGLIREEDVFYFNRQLPSETGANRRFRDVEFHNDTLWILVDGSGMVEITARQ